MAKRKETNRAALLMCGISESDVESLRRVERRLHRWHEALCGDQYGGLWRDDDDPKVIWHYSNYTGQTTRWTGSDMEALALKRLDKIMSRYPQLTYFVQGDPRGCALYILRPDDVPVGEHAESYYTRGVAVF